METRIPAIAVVQRSFGNTRELEGIRVDAGTRFAVEKPIEGLRTISAERYRQLLRVRLVRPLIEEGVEPIAEHQPAEAAPAPARVRPTTRAAGVTRAQDPAPPAPKRLDNPAALPSAPDGSPNGGQEPASSSPADQASSTSNTSSKRRARKPRIAAG